MSGLRVLVISHAYAAPINRGKLHALARRPGLEVSLLAPRRWREGGRDYVTAAGEERGVRVFAGDVMFPGRVGGHFYRDGLWRALRAARPEVIHLEEEPWSLAAGQVLAAAMFWRPRPALAVFSWENLDLRFRWPIRAIEQAALRRADVLIAGGRTARERLIRLGADPGRVEVLPQFGLDPALFRPPGPGEGPGVFTAGFVGRLVPGKGADLLVEALGGLDGEWRALVVGDGPLRPALEARAASAGIAGRVEFTGWVAHEEVPPLLRRMSALAVPSRTTPLWAEQFGHVLIEGMSSGAVPVGSSSGEIPHVIGGEGLVFPEGEAPALREALRRLRDEPGLRDRLAGAGRARVLREFSWEALAGRTCALYERALRGRAPADRRSGGSGR
ncbi:MAG: glycosyltransferase [Candidatus Tectomicrobia bacterium]|nr:glycosyltransferase [Candidatus Tectomicrobia bacterium]